MFLWNCHHVYCFICWYLGGFFWLNFCCSFGWTATTVVRFYVSLRSWLLNINVCCTSVLNSNITFICELTVYIFSNPFFIILLIYIYFFYAYFNLAAVPDLLTLQMCFFHSFSVVSMIYPWQLAVSYWFTQQCVRLHCASPVLEVDKLNKNIVYNSKLALLFSVKRIFGATTLPWLLRKGFQSAHRCRQVAIWFAIAEISYLAVAILIFRTIMCCSNICNLNWWLSHFCTQFNRQLASGHSLYEQGRQWTLREWLPAWNGDRGWRSELA